MKIRIPTIIAFLLILGTSCGQTTPTGCPAGGGMFTFEALLRRTPRVGDPHHFLVIIFLIDSGRYLLYTEPIFTSEAEFSPTMILEELSIAQIVNL
jgi:hypothetical protein